MIRAAIRILIALAVINAVARTGMAYWAHYQLSDAAQQMVVFGAGRSTDQLYDDILARAEELEVPLAPENLDVRRGGGRTTATASYAIPVELIPRYFYPLDLSFAVEGVAIDPLTGL